MGTLGVRIGVTVNCKQRHSQAFFSEGARGGGHGFSVGGGQKLYFLTKHLLFFGTLSGFVLFICLYLFIFCGGGVMGNLWGEANHDVIHVNLL